VRAVGDVGFLFGLGVGLIFVGVFIIVLAAILIVVSQRKSGKVKAAGVVIIGPVPIVFGSDRKSLKTLLALSIVLMVLLVVYYLVLR